MQRYHFDYPQFGFDRHKGYPTKAHKAAIALNGPCLIHRRSFKSVSEHFDHRCTRPAAAGMPAHA
jgi:ribonuclease HII